MSETFGFTKKSSSMYILIIIEMIADLVVKTGEKVMFRNMKKGFSSRCEIILVPSNITHFLYHLHHLLLPCLPSLEHTGALCEAMIEGDIFVELESV